MFRAARVRLWMGRTMVLARRKESSTLMARPITRASRMTVSICSVRAAAVCRLSRTQTT